jgi:hypothetical protein
MPFLDPSILLLDPQLSESFDVIVRVQQVSELGIVSIASTLVQGVGGSVQPAKPNELKRFDDNERGNRAITIYTNHRLNDAARAPTGNPPTQRQPDHILWEGDRYLVREVKPWTHYGAGWVKVLATSIDSIEAELR